MANWWQVRGHKLTNWWQAQRLKLEAKSMPKRWYKLTGSYNPVDLTNSDLISSILNRGGMSEVRLRYTRVSQVPLRKSDLRGINLRGVSLRGVNLFRADLRGANLFRADLSEAGLSGANLGEANLGEATLFRTDLSGADLSGADLSGADLSGADLSRIRSNATIFMYLDFRLTKGLVQINHLGPSAIHLPSLLLPQDGNALHFLRGVGLTDEQIDAWRATAMLPIQYHSLFISYSSKDEILARRLHADLQAHGVRCWFAPEDMKIGNKIRQRIDEAIYLQEKSLLLLSEHSIASDWVEAEVETTLEKERKQQREVIFPVRLDDAILHTSQAWAATLRRTRHIGDFTTWTDPRAYQTVFERLLRDLKAD